MNSDPHESAAWRTFGMLDADEAAGFDEAMRHDPELRNAYREMECLAAAVAVTSAPPVAPGAGQLERLHLKLGLNAAKRTNWAGISGWAAAAVLTMILVLDRSPETRPAIATISPPDPVPTPAAANQSPEEMIGAPDEAGNPDTPAPTAASHDGESKATVRVETKRLIQEIEVLRGKLEGFEERDRVRFEAVPGMAWPVVVQMSPPGVAAETSDALILRKDESPITAMLGDALAATNASALVFDPGAVKIGEASTPPESPSAIPIYDAARDAGTLVVSNLPPPPADEAYNLWVKTKSSGKPIYVGRLPESTALGAESFDFSLGSTAAVPSSFVLTKDKQGAPVSPTEKNTVLQGPR